MRALTKARESVLDKFYSLKAHDVEIADALFGDYFAKLKEYIDTTERELILCNRDISMEECLKYLEKR